MARDYAHLPDWVVVGASFRETHAHGRLLHVRGIVDGQAVLRYWRTSKRYWQYVVEGPIYFALGVEYGTIEIVKRIATDG